MDEYLWVNKKKKQMAEVNCQFLQWKEITNEVLKGPGWESMLFNILINKLEKEANNVVTKGCSLIVKNCRTTS